MKAIIVPLCLALLLIGCGGNSTPPPPPPPTVTGAWSGTIVSASGQSAGASGNLAQGQTQPDGSILFSGSFTFTNSCINLLQISGKILGGSFALTGTFSDGSTLNVTATINAADTAINGNYQNTGGSVCAADHGTFSLTKH